MEIEKYRDSIDFIKSYRSAQNAATGSKYDPNANVEHKNITTMTGEIPKGQMIGINRLLMHDELKKLYGDDVADQYLIDLKDHKIYKHDETSLFPYTYSSKEVVNVVYKGMKYLVSLEQLYDICEERETLVDEEKIVYIKYPEDMTISDRNGYTKVERLIRKKRHRNLVRVETAFGEDLIVTDNHPLIVNEDINDTVEAVSSVGLRQYRCNSRTNFDGVTEIDAKDVSADTISLDKELGYLVGFIIGDGNYDETTKSITITQKDKEVIEVLGDIAYRKLGNVPIVYKSKNDNCYSLILENPMLISLLYDKFRIGHTANNKCLPINIYHYSKDFAIGIIEGLANSSINKEPAPRTLILQLSDVLRNLKLGEAFSDKEDISDIWVNIIGVDEIDDDKFLEDNEFIYDITTSSHSFICNNIWVHNCVSITMYPYLFNGMKNIGGISEPPKNLQSFCGSFVNLIFAIASQFAGAVSTPEFLTYMDYFIRKEYGDDYYKHPTKVVDLSKKQRTIDNTICQYWQQIVYSLNQPAAARNYQSVK